MLTLPLLTSIPSGHLVCAGQTHSDALPQKENGVYGMPGCFFGLPCGQLQAANTRGRPIAMDSIARDLGMGGCKRRHIWAWGGFMDNYWA